MTVKLGLSDLGLVVEKIILYIYIYIGIYRYKHIDILHYI